MRRLARRLFTLCSAASLLLCVGTAVLWARSYNVLYHLRRSTVDQPTGSVRMAECMLASGRLTVSVSLFQNDPDPSALKPARWQLHRDPYYYAWRSDAPGPWLWGGQVRTGIGITSWGPAETRSFTLNLTVVVALTAVCPAVWRLRHLRRRRRRRDGLCVSCGYDLRASPERCPECGARARRAGRQTGDVRW